MLKRLLLALGLGLSLSFAHAATVDQGIAALEAGQGDRAFTIFHELARGGEAKAQLYLGLMYYNGQGVDEDNEQAAHWFQQAAKQGNARAQYELAQMLVFGFARPDDLQNPYAYAISLYTKAADQGYVDAQFELGFMYLTGKGVEADEAKGVAWMRKAAAQGHEQAKSFVSDFQ